jgi:UDP-GlcNAc:undecaprenyl-phosphate GlcNAc-1-phosphate transferase
LPEEIRLVGSFALALALASILVPVAIRLALRTGFLDRPIGYKGHARPTPYLGGAAIVVAVAITVIASGAATSRFAPILIWAFVLFVVGTVDDKRSLNPAIRLVIEAGAAGALWYYGLGWAILPGDAANIALTVVWIVGVVNAFNLMDNMDGAASTVAAVSAAGAAALAIILDDVALAVILLAVSAACAAFLRFNLSRPARIFLGDGGSMPIGFLIAAAVMAMPAHSNLGWSGLFLVAPLVGLPILDTALVVISRRRGGRPVLSGGRDHLTHRLHARLGSARFVAVCLASAQAVLCLIVLPLSQAGAAPIVVLAAVYVAAAAAAIYTLELRWDAPAWAAAADHALQVPVGLGEVPAAENAPA